ncbi:hypothetical protein, partial [Escherichia coli]|uniref:hypothetical protein n=1 Tax=Escherichia coli TaxID=562 RepID=UPI001BFE536C
QHACVESAVHEQSEVKPGNIYPAKGGKGDTEYWLVIAVSPTGAHLIGFNKEGIPCSTASYLKSAMRERPVIGRVDLGEVVIKEQ